MRPSLKSLLCAAAAIVALVHATPRATAQCTQQVWLPEPNSLPSNVGINDGGTINATALHPSGDVIVAGYFSIAGGVPVNNIARYNPTTREWSALGAGIGAQGSISSVYAVSVTTGGDIIAGGLFASAGGVTASNIARYNPQTDTWSPLGIGVSGTVYALSVTFTGDLLVGGDFTGAQSSGGAVPGTKGVARYNLVTGVWSSIGGGLGSPTANTSVRAVAQMTNGDVVAYDLRPEPIGTSEPFRRYRASTGQWATSFLSYTPAIPSPEGHLIALPNGDLAMAAPGLPTGNNYAVFSPSQNAFSPLGVGLAGTATSLTLAASGDILATGVLSHPSRTWTISVARYSPSTLTWTPLDSAGEGTFNQNAPNAAVQLPSGDVIAAGHSLMVLDDVNFHGGLARYIAASQRWEASFGTQRPPNSIATLPGGDVIVGGLFTNAGGVPVNNIARYNPVTGQWSALGAGTNGVVNAVAVLTNGNVLVGGSFTTAGGLSIFRLALYNPTTGVWSAAGGVGGVTGAAVYAILALPNGDAIVGGKFTTPGRRIARYNAATNTTSFIGHAGPSGPISQTGAHTVYSFALHPSGDIYIGGYFPDLTTQIGNFARYNPATNTTTVLTISTSDIAISALAAAPDGNIILGFGFGASGMARYNPVASTLVQVSGTPDGAVRALATMDSGRILVGGEFSNVGVPATPSESLAVFDPATNSWQATPGALYGYNLFNSYVSALVTRPGGEFFAVGQFWWPSGSVLLGEYFRYNNVAHYGCPPVAGCDAIDFNGDGLYPDTADIDDFLSVFSGGPCSTGTCGDIDFNNDGLFPDTADIDALLSVFSGGACL